MSLSELLEKRAAARPTVHVRLVDFLAGDIEGAIAVRALNVSEDGDATKAAVEYRRGLISQLPERFMREFLEDHSFLEDARSVEKLWRACRSVDDVSQPAFPSAQWMRENFTHDELQTLFGFYESAVMAAGRTVEVDRDVVAFMAAGSARGEFDARSVLMTVPRPVLVDAFEILSGLYIDAIPDVSEAA